MLFRLVCRVQVTLLINSRRVYNGTWEVHSRFSLIEKGMIVGSMHNLAAIPGMAGFPYMWITGLMPVLSVPPGTLLRSLFQPMRGRRFGNRPGHRQSKIRTPASSR